jgi:osmoprotectant transport system permease protein
VASPALFAADIGSKWLYWPWVSDHVDEIRALLWEHLVLTALAVGFGVLIATPLAIVSRNRRSVYAPVLTATAILYTIPSLAAFALLLPITGLGRETALIPLTAYTLVILVRNTVTGLQGVPNDVLDAATGMGYTPTRRFWRVELPLAMPAIIAGVRIATVSTIGLVTVAAVIGQGGLGDLIFVDGFQRDFRTPIVVGVTLSLALAVAADLLLLGALTLATPWRRARQR